MINKLWLLNDTTCSLDIYLWNSRRDDGRISLQMSFSWSDQDSYLDIITAEARERRHIEDFAFIGDIGAFAYFCILDRGRDATSDTEHFDQWQLWLINLTSWWRSQYHGKLYTLGNLDSVSDFLSLFDWHDLVTCPRGMFVMWHYPTPRPHHSRAVDSSIWNLATLKDFTSQHSTLGLAHQSKMHRIQIFRQKMLKLKHNVSWFQFTC